MQRGLLLSASAVIAAAGALAFIAASRMQRQAAARAAMAQEREKALILAVGQLCDASPQRHGLHAIP